MSGEIRYHWEHSITEMDACRWSITLRSLSQKALTGVVSRSATHLWEDGERLS